MNLQFHLISRITVVGLICLLATAAYALYRSERQSGQAAQTTAESLTKQLEFQLLRINAGFGQADQFPDFTLWKQTANAPGICLRFVAGEGSINRGLCNGASWFDHSWPDGFEIFYRKFFNRGFEITRSIAYKGRVYGVLTVTPSAEMKIARAWENIQSLLGLSALTVLSVCLLVYLIISRALRPAGIIVAGLEHLEQGRLDYRLPRFELNEWQRTAAAINQLAASQQQLLAERQKLAVRLMQLQEVERRFLARELHDEFGQCLAGINAVAASIAHTAAQQCPGLVEEAGHISRICQYMLDSVRGLLGRLRPAELDELGLAASLNTLVAGWNMHSSGKTHYQLNLAGDCAALPEQLAVTLFRVIQECLTNIARHSKAVNAGITLIINTGSVSLSIKDDGIASGLPFAESQGIGLLGIRERVTALNGQLALAINIPHGLIVEVRLPICSSAETKI